MGGENQRLKIQHYIVPDSSSEYGFHIILYKNCFVIFTSKPVNLCTFAKH